MPGLQIQPGYVRLRPFSFEKPSSLLAPDSLFHVENHIQILARVDASFQGLSAVSPLVIVLSSLSSRLSASQSASLRRALAVMDSSCFLKWHYTPVQVARSARNIQPVECLSRRMWLVASPTVSASISILSGKLRYPAFLLGKVYPISCSWRDR